MHKLMIWSLQMVLVPYRVIQHSREERKRQEDARRQWQAAFMERYMTWHASHMQANQEMDTGFTNRLTMP